MQAGPQITQITQITQILETNLVRPAWYFVLGALYLVLGWKNKVQSSKYKSSKAYG
jgi:hypothetical protein